MQRAFHPCRNFQLDWIANKRGVKLGKEMQANYRSYLHRIFNAHESIH